MIKNNNPIGQYLIKIKPSNIYAIGVVSKYLCLSGIFLVLAIKFYNLLIFISLIFAVYAWYKLLSIISIVYTITEETIVIRTGIIARNFNTLELYRVKDYITQQSVILRIFNLMTVTLVTNDDSSPNLKLVGIPFSNVAETIRDLVQEARINNRIYEIT